MKFHLSLIAALAAGLAFNAYGGDGPITRARVDHRSEVTALLKSIQTRDPAPAAAIDPEKYIQHNLGGSDGLAAFQGLLAAAPPSTQVNTVRVFQDGDFVFAHTDYDFFGRQAGFDIFRYENGKIVEHWDNLQPESSTSTPSGHTLFDGPVAATVGHDAGSTEYNKALVRTFMDEVMVDGHVDAVVKYVDGKTLVQHDPAIADGVAAYRDALAKQASASSYVVLHEVLGQGDFVLAVSSRKLAGKPQAAYDLFRISDGKIVEHWDVVADIPPPSNWSNGNGKFGF